jgi:hypothetical protein
VGRFLATVLSAVFLLCAADAAWAQNTGESEAQFRTAALVAAARYGTAASSYTYQPQPRPDGSERAASTVAITGHILLEAHAAGGGAIYLDKARTAGDSLLAHPDMNGNGTTGWGRYWAKAAGSPSIPGDGSNTTFSIGCTLAPNKPYDDEMYDNARVGHFLLDLHLATKDPRYLAATRKMLDDTWNDGEATPEGGFYYNKTVGACDRGWHVKNVNMLMAVPMALMAKITGERKYQDRIAAMMRAETIEVRREVNGRPAPNLGYYAVQTMREHPTQGTYVQRAQTTDTGTAIRCNPKTGSGDSCWKHLGLEARSIDLVNRILGHEHLATMADVKTVMADVVGTDRALCGADKSPTGFPRNWSHCAAYYCALRRLDDGWSKLCLERALPQNLTPDIALGLFWGRPDRFSAVAGQPR